MSTTIQERSPVSGLREHAVRLAELAATPLIPDDYLDILSPLASNASLRGRVLSIQRETADAATLRIKPGRTWRSHTPGQYVRIGVDIDGVRQWRAYSVTSPVDRPDGCITITVKAMPDGFVSNHLVHRIQVGTIIQLDQACGDFVIGETAPEKTLFVTAGSGITPVMGMLRDNTDQLGDVLVLHSAPTKADVIFGAELRQLDADGRIKLIERHTDLDGMLDTETLASLVPDFAHRETWACGPSGLLDALEQFHFDTGIEGQLHTERFRPSVIVPGEGER